MPYSDFRLDPSFTLAALEETFVEQMKFQERLALTVLVAAQGAHIHLKGQQFETDLNEKAEALKTYASQTFVSNIEEGFEGKAASSARDYLINGLKKPELKSAIRQW